MATLPMDRTKLNTAIANQQPSIVASAQANREFLVEAADTVDLLNQKVDGLTNAGALAPLPPDLLFRQALVNGNFDIWQRGTTFNQPNFVYTADRYRVNSSVDNNARVLRSTNVPNSMSTYSMRIEAYNSVSASGDTSAIQIIEDYTPFRSKTVYLSGWCKCDAGVTASASIEDGVTGGVTISLASTAWTYFSAPLIVAGTATQLAVRLKLIRNDIAVGKGVNFAQLQLSTGGVLPFQPRSVNEELALCQRYCTKLISGFYDEIGMGISAASNTVFIAIPLMAIPRTNPTYTFRGSFSLVVGSTEYEIQASNVLIESTSARSGGIKISGAGMPTIAAGLPVKLRANLDSYVVADMEL